MIIRKALASQWSKMVREFQPQADENVPLSNKLMKNRRRRVTKVEIQKKGDDEAKKESSPLSFIGEELLDDDDSQKDNSPVEERKALKSATTEGSVTLEAVVTSFSQPRALAIDTRVTEGIDNSSTVRGLQSFLKILNLRGLVPQVYCSTESQKSNTISIHSETNVDHMTVEAAPYTAKSPQKCHKALTAKWSWKLASNFGRFTATYHSSMYTHLYCICTVQRLVEEYNDNDDSSSKTPLEVTIVTTDLSWFADVNITAHSDACKGFVETVVPYFVNNRVSSIHIVVAKTNCLALKAQDTDQDEDKEQDQRAHDLAVTKCLFEIHNQLACHDSTSSSLLGQMPVRLEMSTIHDSPIGYHHLARQWAQQQYVTNSSCLQLTLPETFNGTQCSLSLAVTPQLQPARGKEDYSNFDNASTMECVQTVPFAMVDASLVYGIPMVVTASLQDDWEEYQRMQALVQGLLANLDKRNVGLVVKIDCQPWLLLPRDDPRARSGILVRYATAEMLLHSDDVPFSSGAEATDPEVAEYVDQALDCLECKALNPLLPDGEDLDDFMMDTSN